MVWIKNWKVEWQRSWEGGKFSTFWVLAVLVFILSCCSFLLQAGTGWWFLLIAISTIGFFIMWICSHYIQHYWTLVELSPESIRMGGEAEMPTPVATLQLRVQIEQLDRALPFDIPHHLRDGELGGIDQITWL